MNFQYLDDLDCEFLHSSCELKETVFSLNENSIEKICNNEEEAKETKTSSMNENSIEKICNNEEEAKETKTSSEGLTFK